MRGWLLVGWIVLYTFGVSLMIGPLVDRVRGWKVRA